ncbi:MAG: amino acid decarboxylase [Gemmatimonadetes bacterium]|nr:amino acid decarboxylase [Gemmatimonadota bacterium]
MPATGDMPPEEFRRYGHEVIDWIADYFEQVGSYPVLPRVSPGDVAGQLPELAPEEPAEMSEILADFRDVLVPGVTHWNHPAFFGYFAISGSGPGVLGETLAAALNVNAMLWRTSPSATELEERALSWLRQLMGLPADFHGHIQDTASTSTMVALAGARERAGLGVREDGLTGRALPRLRVYCSEEAHSVVEKSCVTLGLGLSAVRRVATDEAFRLAVPALRAAIEADVAAGDLPIAVVATVGTTSTTAVDPVPEIADICHQHGLWLHVDAAYGGAAAILPEMRHILRGCELADSLTVNPHKWLFVPVDCSALYLRDPNVVRRAFAYTLDILKTSEGEAATNLMEYGPALGRRFRALKLWMVLRYFGRSGIADRIREHIRLAALFASWVDVDPEWERMAPTEFSTVCFRYHPPGASDAELDRVNQGILDALNESGETLLSQARLRGRLSLRLAIGNIRTAEEHLRAAWELLMETAMMNDG